MEYINGVVYEGDWRDSCYCGEGMFTSPEGHKYTGQFVKNAFNGHGRMEYPNGDVYIGNWRDDTKWGAGSMSFGNGRAHQVGTWEKGVFHEGTDYVLPKNCPRKAAKFFGEESQLDSSADRGGASMLQQQSEESVETKYSNAIDAWENAATDRSQGRERTKRFHYGSLLVQGQEAKADDKDSFSGLLPSKCPPKAAKVLGAESKLPADCPKKAAAFFGNSTVPVPGPTASSLHPRTRGETKAEENAADCDNCTSEAPGKWSEDDYFFTEAGAGRAKFGGLGSPTAGVDTEHCVGKFDSMSYEVRRSYVLHVC